MSEHERRPAPQELAVDHDQAAPGDQARMRLQPDSDLSNYRAAGKLSGKAQCCSLKRIKTLQELSKRSPFQCVRDSREA